MLQSLWFLNLDGAWFLVGQLGPVQPATADEVVKLITAFGAVDKQVDNLKRAITSKYPTMTMRQEGNSPPRAIESDMKPAKP